MAKKQSRELRITSIIHGEIADRVGVKRFTEAMEHKLGLASGKGRYGWNRTVGSGWGVTVEGLEQLLREQLHQGVPLDTVDVANYCMMIWNRKNPRGRT